MYIKHIYKHAVLKTQKFQKTYNTNINKTTPFKQHSFANGFVIFIVSRHLLFEVYFFKIHIFFRNN